MRVGETIRPPLREGDTIGVVAPGFAVRREAVRSGIAWLEDLGHPVIEGRRLFAREGYLAGTDIQRADDLNRMMRDPQVRCIWFARGGYGMARILPLLDWAALREQRKLFVGYSDATALFARVATERWAPCVLGPMVGELGDSKAFHAASLFRALRGETVEIPFAQAGVLRHGRAAGPILGGNLNVLVHLLGTPFAPKLDGAMLVLEEIGEEVYRIDRMLTHLAATGALANLAGVALGRFVVPKPRRSFPPDRPLVDVLREKFDRVGIPVVTGLPFGHVARKASLPLGGIGKLDSRKGSLVISHPAFRTAPR